MRWCERGGLHCQTVDQFVTPHQRPSIAVILCHGYGAPADDLAPIGAELLRTSQALREGVRFYFPAAPLDLGPLGIPGGRAWWALDMQRLVIASQTGHWDELRSEVPAGLPEARAQLLSLIDDVRAETQLPLSRIVLGGFSQGAMLTMDLALRLPEPVAAVCGASGVLIAEREWTELAAKQRPLRVLLSHGRQDPILPFYGAEALRDLLMKTGHQVEFLAFDGGHTIPWPMLSAFAKLLNELVTSSEKQPDKQ
jgi:phospholipase/carboxylesterase